MAKCENCIHQYVCEKRTCAECVGIYCDECEIYCQYDGKPDIEKCKDFINEADVVKVVRCKDCKHSRELDKHCEINRNAYRHCALWRGEETINVWHKYTKHWNDYSIVEPDDYCSCGERG